MDKMEETRRKNEVEKEIIKKFIMDFPLPLRGDIFYPSTWRDIKIFISKALATHRSAVVEDCLKAVGEDEDLFKFSRVGRGEAFDGTRFRNYPEVSTSGMLNNHDQEIRQELKEEIRERLEALK